MIFFATLNPPGLGGSLLVKYEKQDLFTGLLRETFLHFALPNLQLRILFSCEVMDKIYPSHLGNGQSIIILIKWQRVGNQLALKWKCENWAKKEV